MASSTSESSSDDDGDVPCAECGALYGSDEKLWISVMNVKAGCILNVWTWPLMLYLIYLCVRTVVE